MWTCPHTMSHVHMNVNVPFHTWKSRGACGMLTHLMSMWMWHVTYDWVVPHMNETCHIWMSHVTYEWVMSCMQESWCIWDVDTLDVNVNVSCHTYDWVMSNMWVWHVTYGWVMSHLFMSVARHIWMSHATHEWVMSHMNDLWQVWKSRVAYGLLTRWTTMWMWHVTHMTESCHTRECDMYRVTYGWVMSHMNETCHTWMGHVTYEWVLSCMNQSCHVWMSHVTYY